jgi:TRAP transporter TAXI family solute receptor
VLDRRDVLRGLAAAGALAATGGLAGCASPFTEARLQIATGGTQGVYFALGSALAKAWQQELGMRDEPEVLSTAGSVDNLRLLTSHGADIAFSQVDAAADVLRTLDPSGPAKPCALGRIYDEFVHVVVPRDSPAQRLADLRGLRVSVGAEESGVYFVAKRLLETAGLAVADLRTEYLGINDSVAAMADGRIDAFFWTGGVPTGGVDALAQRMPIRLLDLEDLLSMIRKTYPVYAPGTVPARSYGIPKSVTTVLVRNFLLVDASMADDLAYALIKALFEAQKELVVLNPLARSIDLRAAISTQPVPLHPGALRYFRDAKDA